VRDFLLVQRNYIPRDFLSSSRGWKFINLKKVY